MVRNCIVCQKYWRKTNARSFHKFPRVNFQRQQWLKNLKLNEEDIKRVKDAKVCSDHFSPEDLFSNHNRTFFLKFDALPIEFPRDIFNRQLWLKNLNLNEEDLKKVKDATVCSDHFSPKDLFKNIGQIVHLKFNVLPIEFPKDISNRQLWLKNLNLNEEDLIKVKAARICSDHFLPKDLFSNGQTVHLKSNCLPIEFPVDISRRKSWFSALDIESDTRRFIYLCCNHFSSTDFELLPSGLLRLKKTAIPCVAGFSATYLKDSITEDECSNLEKRPQNKLAKLITKDQYDERIKKRAIQSPEVNVQPPKRICSEPIAQPFAQPIAQPIAHPIAQAIALSSQLRMPVQIIQLPQIHFLKGNTPTLILNNDNKLEFKGFSGNQQIQLTQSSSVLDCSSGYTAVNKENTENYNVKRFIEVEHNYGRSSNCSENKIVDERETGRSSNISEIKIVDDSETDTAEETDTGDETDIKIEQEELNEKTEQEEEIIIIHSVDDSCEEKNKKDKSRIAYNNPIWLRKKIETQKMQMEYFKTKNLDLRCKIIEMKISLGFKGKNIKRSDYVNAADAPVGDYPGFTGMLKQAAVQQIDKNTAMKAIFRLVDELKLKKYDNAFKKWLQFCSKSNVNVFKPEISDVLDFFKALLAPGTINYHGFVIYKKAIVGMLGDDKASDTRLKEFLEELDDLFHAFQRRSYTWDPHNVLLHLSKYFPNEIIGLADLSRKVVTLLALVTKVGLLSLANLKLDDVTVTETEVLISFADYSSETVCRSNNTIVKLPLFIETPQLCVASALTHYIEQSSRLRGLDKESSLFIELEYPYNAASITTLNKWIRESMLSAGVEFAMFSDLLANLNSLKDHQNEVLFDEIKRRVKWTDDMLIFTSFYSL